LFENSKFSNKTIRISFNHIKIFNIVYNCSFLDVGNKAAVFPLQLLGFEVDIINSVHFSNHTGYPGGWEGDVLGGEQLTLILNGLERNGLLSKINHLLTGYIGSESFLRSVLNVLHTIKKQKGSDNIRFVCDPVLGDNGKLYVPKELIPVYREEVIPLANVLTPNQFETELLTGISISTIEDGQNACKYLHDIGPKLVVITSLNLTKENDVKMITILASERVYNDGMKIIEDHVWCIDTPVISGQFTGTGDVCCALLLAWTAKEPNNLSAALEKVASTMFQLIKVTAEDSDDTIASKELKLIKSKKTIEAPNIIFQARRL